MGNRIISKEEYLTLMNPKTFSPHFISDLPCRLGHSKTFVVVEFDKGKCKDKVVNTIECRCTQQGGLVTGRNVFTYMGNE